MYIYIIYVHNISTTGKKWDSVLPRGAISKNYADSLHFLKMLFLKTIFEISEANMAERFTLKNPGSQ